MFNIEREYSTVQAKEFALTWIKNHGYTYELQQYTTKDHKFKVCSAFLKNKGKIISMGNGKGLGDEPVVGALFETIEHFYYNSQKHYDNLDISTTYLKKQMDILNISNYPVDMICRQEEKVQVDKFLSIDEKNDFYYPCLLNDTNFNKIIIDNVNIDGYRSNNGYAIGATRNEAILHALNEVIERDSISKVLIKFGLGFWDDIDCWEFDKKTLPYNVEILTTSIEKTIGADIRIIKIQNVYAIPTILCVAKNNKWRYPLYGLGTSLSLEYATTRALTELLQLALLFGKEDRRLFKKLDKQWYDYPKIKNMINFKFLQDRPVKDWEYGKKINCYKNVNDLILEEIERLHKYNREVFMRWIYEDTGINVVQVIVPGTELFNLILEGATVIPCNYKELRKFK